MVVVSVWMMRAPTTLPRSVKRAAGERSPAEDHGEDGVQLEEQAGVVPVGALHVGAPDQAGDPGAETADRVDPEGDGAGAEPREARGYRVEPDRDDETDEGSPARAEDAHG